jgi:hypothetical protein
VTTAVVALLAMVATCWLGNLPAAAASTRNSKFCTRLSDFAGSFPANLSATTPAKAAALVRLLNGAKSVAPRAPEKAVSSMASALAAISKAPDTTRAAVVAQRDTAYTAALATLTSYNSNSCPVPVPKTPTLPGVVPAQETACLQDQAVLRQAEDLYSTVNGGFATMSDLVAAQYVRQVSSYYADVRVDDPPGGYTLVAVVSGPCANFPVAG